MSFAPGDKLLLALARVTPDPDALARARVLVAGELDWSVVIESAIRHGVAPLVSRALEAVAPRGDPGDPIPAPARTELGRLAAISDARNERLLGVMGEILVAFDARGLAALGLKDVGLAVEVYPEPGLRPLGDLDLLIRRADYRVAASVMAELGFRPLPRREIPHTLRYAWAHHFHRPQGNVWVDLQWGVMQREWSEPGAGRRSFDGEDLWRGARPVQLPGPGDREMLVASCEATLFHLCGHLEGHGYGELVLFSDIAAALDRWADSLDWDAVATLADSYEARATMYHVLLSSRALVGAQVPDDALALFDSDVFRGAVFGPIFGGSTSMHLALDEIADAAAPPPPLLRRLERDVRSQAARARVLYDELDALVTRYRGAGGDLIVLEGDDKARRFPDDALSEFGELRVVVPASQSERLRSAWEDCGWRTMNGGALERTVPVPAKEPVLAGARLRLRMVGARLANLDELLRSEVKPLSNRQAALASLRVRLRGTRTVAEQAHARVVFASLDDDQLLTWLLVRLGSIEHEVLFGLPQLLDFVRLCHAEVDGSRVVREAERLGVQYALGRGLAIAAEVVPDERRLAAVGAALSWPLPAPRAFQWAREGPVGLERHGELRAAYLFVLCLLKAGAGERRQLLRSGLRRRDGRPAPLLDIARASLRGVRSLSSGKPANAHKLVYWLEA